MGKARDAMEAVEADGWVFHHKTGSHRHYEHPSKPGVVTIPGHPSDDLAPGTEASIYRQAGIPKPRRGGNRR
jgi:predicted RNA binding protein YcfA (HicA-like mRNA interferase family)